MNSDHEVCPWWLAYTFDNPLRRLVHNPGRILAGLVEEDQTVADVGCGMGYWSLAMARMVGPTGRVIAIDLQEKMLATVRRRARRRGLESRIELRLVGADTLGLDEMVDFALAFWMVHEAPDQDHLFRELRAALKPEARLLVVEPRWHVDEESFERTVTAARSADLEPYGPVAVRISRTMLFRRG